jgi:hypothetical protein
MRLVTLGCVLVFLSALTTQARRVIPGVSFTATLQSDVTDASATMTWTTKSSCTQGLIVSGRPEFRCAGRWRCEGDACPGRRGHLEFTFDPDGLHDVLLRVSRHSVCTARFVGIVQGPQAPPYHWSYDCFRLPTIPIDFGAAVVALQSE